MPDPVSALAIGGSQLIGGMMQADAAQSASDAQSASAAAGIAEQRRQFDAIQELLRPYVNVGVPALEQQKAIVGLGGQVAQQSAIDAIQNSPLFRAQIARGESSILQNAAATGGLRGGNTQAALAQLSPQMLRQEIEQQYSKLGGLTSLGQQSAAGVGTAGQAMGGNVANLLAQQGAAQAGGILGQAGAYSGLLGAASQGSGAYYGLTGKSPFSNLFGGQSSGLTQFGTIPGSQQSAMLADQMRGF